MAYPGSDNQVRFTLNDEEIRRRQEYRSSHPATWNFRDVLSQVLRQGAQRLLVEAIEVEEFLAEHAGQRGEAGRQRVVRNGNCPSARFRPASAVSP